MSPSTVYDLIKYRRLEESARQRGQIETPFISQSRRVPSRIDEKMRIE